MNPDNPLERLRSKLSTPSSSYLDPSLYARLSLVQVGNVIHVDFYGCPFEEPYNELCRVLVNPDVAPHLASVTLRSPDEGANGTCNWDLTAMAESDVRFPELRLFSIQQVSPNDHNRIIVAADYDEAGTLAQLLRRAPALDALISPSAPDKSFFAVTDHPLRYLNVDAGYDTQGFIGNLADSRSFPNLQSLEFGEYNETYVEDFAAGCTAFADYRRLFLSPAFSTVRSFTWRNPVCSPSEVAELRTLRPVQDLQFKVLRFSGAYVGQEGA